MSTLKVNKIRDTAGSADSITLDPNGGAVIAGVTTVSTVKVGSGVTITSDGNIFHTGVCTATSFAGEIPAASIVGVATAGFERSGGFPQGVTEADSWYLTSSFSGSATPIANNLSRCNLSGDGFDKLGTGMSVSSGIWTFPSTGHWLVHGDVFYEQISGYQSRFNEFSIHATENNSSYVEVARGGSYFDNYDAQRVNNATCQAIIDCTDTSNVKIKFNMSINESNVETQGSGSIYKTRFNFIRLADT